MLPKSDAWIITRNGKRIFFDDPYYRDNEYTIDDIAHALSYIPRWGAHSTDFISVAQHCCVVSDLLAFDSSISLQGLMHDAVEAYVGDMTNPLKSLIPEYKRIESRLEEDLFNKLRIPQPLSPLVKMADLMSLAQEARDYLPPFPTYLHLPRPPLERLMPWSPCEAKEQFIARWQYLKQYLTFAEIGCIERTVAPLEVGHG